MPLNLGIDKFSGASMSMRQTFSEFIPEKLWQKLRKIEKLLKNFFYEEIRISFIDISTPKGLTLILVKKIFRKNIKIRSGSWFQISDRES
jgi:hypothetical protein